MMTTTCQRCGARTSGTRENDTEYCTSCGGVLGSAHTATTIHETPAGDKIEFRRVNGRDEHRLLKRDGTPHADGWYPVSDAMRLALDHAGSDVLRVLGEDGGRGAEPE